MRIIDKNSDFYDYLQNVYRDDSITFDRTDSFLLTKDTIRYRLSLCHKHSKYEFMLLQVCNTFWLFLLYIQRGKDEYGFSRVDDYDIELLQSWKNYDKKRVLSKFSIIDFGYQILERFFECPYLLEFRLNEERLIDNIPVLVDAINMNDYKELDRVDEGDVFLGNGERVRRHIPILKSCGVPSVIDPLDIYLSFEEYFSLEKQASERTASIGITDAEKIENHGFDTKVSFRGK